MAYRGELDQLRLRVEELESALEAEKETVARLRGERTDVVVGSDKPDWITGVPPKLRLERVLPFEVSDTGFEAIAALIEQKLPGGTASQVGRSFTHKKASYQLQLARTRDGTTTMVLDGDYSVARLLLLLGGPGIGILTGPLTAGLLGAAGLSPPVLLIGALIGGIAGFFGIRALMKRNMLAERRRLIAMFEAVADVAARHRVAPGARIAPQPLARVPVVGEASPEQLVPEQLALEQLAEQELAAAQERVAAQEPLPARRVSGGVESS